MTAPRRSETRPEGRSGAQPESLPGAQPESLPGAQPDSLPGAQPDSQRGTEPESQPGTKREVITDARAMRALAHPLRVALLEAIRRDGEITATQAAELLGESPGNMSWHLQTLAKYGFVEEAGGGRGRTRPWRATRTSDSFDSAVSEPEAMAAGEALERMVVERSHERIHEWWARRQQYSVEWRRAAFISEALIYVTHEELATIADEIVEIFTRYHDRDVKRNRPAGAVPVQISAHGHPLPPTAAGN